MTPIEFVLKWEGVFTPPSPDDPGGVTKYGISQRAYPDLDILNLTEQDAIDIYERDYCWPIGAGSLPPPLALCAVNAAVNCGVSRARKWLNASGGNYREFLLYQMAHYVGLKNRTFIQGWMNRTLDAWYEAKKLEV